MGRREYPAFGDWVFDQGKELSNEIDHSLGDFVKRCLLKLDDTDRDLLLMYYHERKTYREIGEILGALRDKDYDRRHAFYYVKRARDRLREIMDEEFTGLNRSERDTYERISS